MRSIPRPLVVSVIIFLTIAPRLLPVVSAQSQSDALSKVETAFGAVTAAENAGANVSSLDDQLNSALDLISQGASIQESNQSAAQQLFSQAEVIASQVVSEARAEQSAGQVSTTRGEAFFGAELLALGVAGVMVYLYLPSLFWRIWLRLNRESTVTKA